MNQFIKVVCFSLLFVNFYDGFKYPSNNINTIKNIVNSNAMFTTFTNSINTEFMNENLIMNEMNQIEYHHQFNIFYLLLFLVSFYAKYNYNQKIEHKWENLEMFSTTQNATRKFLFVFMVVFTKNIDNAI
jgi:hypothetical protein